MSNWKQNKRKVADKKRKLYRLRMARSRVLARRFRKSWTETT